MEGDLWLGCHKGYCVSEKGLGIERVQGSCPELGELRRGYMKGCTIGGSETVGEGVLGVMTLGSELGRKKEANRWLSVEGLSSFPCLAPESLFCFDLRSIVLGLS